MAEETTETSVSNYIEQTAEIVAAYVEHYAINRDDLPKLIAEVHASLWGLDGRQTASDQQDLTPAAPIKRSVMPDYIVCLECGKRFKSLKRHLRTEHDLTAEQYREKWKLPVALGRERLIAIGPGAARRGILVVNDRVGHSAVEEQPLDTVAAPLPPRVRQVSID